MRLSDIMSNAGLAGYAEIALILFIVVFLAVVIRIFRPGRKAEMDAAARLPLEDDQETTSRKDEQP